MTPMSSSASGIYQMDDPYAKGRELRGEQFIITAGTNIHMPVGPFPSEEAAHAEYRRNQPSGQVYLSPPTIVRLLKPALGYDGESDGSGDTSGVPNPDPSSGSGASQSTAAVEERHDRASD